MFETLLNGIRNFFAVEESTNRSTSIGSVEKINVDVDSDDCPEKDFNSLVTDLDESLFRNCCLVCSSGITSRFFPETDDMVRRKLNKIYGLKGISPEECIGPNGEQHGWIQPTDMEEEVVNQIFAQRNPAEKFFIFDGPLKLFVKYEDGIKDYDFYGKISINRIDNYVSSVDSSVYNSFKEQLLICKCLSKGQLKNIGNIPLSSKDAVRIQDGLSRLKSMRVRFSWISFIIIDKMLQVEEFSEIQKGMGENYHERKNALGYVYSKYLEKFGFPITNDGDRGYWFIEYLSKNKGELMEKYNLKDILNIESRYASDDEMVQFIKYNNGNIYMCDGHEATMGLYKIPFNKLDSGSNVRGGAFENVVLEFFRSYLEPECVDSFYIKKKDVNETDVIAWESDEEVVILGECKINQRYGKLNMSAERAFGKEGYITKSIDQLNKRVKLIKSGEEIKPIKSKSVNYTIPKDIKEYEIISLSIHASEYISPMYLEGVHIISLESLVMVLRSVDEIKDFKKYMSFRKECIDKNGEKEYDEFDILYSYRKGNVKPENLKIYKCDSAWMPFDISDNEWREFINERGKYRNLVRPI